MPLLTQGFASRILLQRHARYHSQEVNARDEAHYLTLADAFLGGPRRDTTEECVRRTDRAIIRWDTVTDEYGILNENGYILSYYINDRNYHPGVTKRAYFENDCRS